MKRTLIALIALAGMANAAWYNVTGTTGDDLFANDGTHYTMFVNGTGGQVAVSDTPKSAFTTSEGTHHNLNFGASSWNTAAPSVSISEALYVDQINTERATSLTINFNEAGSITASKEFSVSSSLPVSISASLSTSEKNALSNGETVTRTLVTTDYFETVPNFKDTLTLSIQADGLSYGGLLYSVYANGSHTYYSFDDVTFGTDKAPNRYVTVKTTASAYELEAGKYYTVLSGTQETGASVKYLSFVATAPEPATATLSILALAGLMARRRRKS
ncbi:MAG: hypothetical protein ACI4P8_06805 [Akkermansia sp.]